MPAFAESGQNITIPDQSGKSDITATVEASNFDITVPLGLPLYLHADGSVTTATDAKIINNSQGPIIVENVKLTPADNWKLASFTDNYKIKKVNSNELGFQIMNENVLVDGSVNMQAEDWPSIPGNGNISLNYDGKVPVRSSDGTMIAANLELTFDWDKNDLAVYPDEMYLGRGSKSQLEIISKPDSTTNTALAVSPVLLLAETNSGVVFSSSDESIAIVDSNGIVTGISPGSAVITAKMGNIEDTSTVTVLDLSVSATEGGIASLSYDNKESSDEIVFAATAKEGFVFNGWTDINGNKVTEDTLYKVRFGTKDISLRANFKRAKDYFEVKLNADPEEGGITQGAGTYKYDDIATVQAVPNENYRFTTWSDNNTNIFRQIRVTDDENLTAKFIYDEEAKNMVYKINASADPEGSGTVTGAGQYNQGDTVTLEAEPEEGFAFKNWTDADGNIITKDKFTFKAVKDMTWVAHFVTNSYTVDVKSNGNGTVTGSGTYKYNETANIEAIPNEGYVFDGWSDGNKEAERSIKVTENITLTGTFKKADFTVNLNVQGNGKVYINNENINKKSFNYGDSVTIKAEAEDHASFTKWSDDNTEAERTFTITDNISLTAIFKTDQFNVTLTSNEGGSVEGAGKYDYNSNVNIKAVAKPGYKFINWTDKDNNAVSTEADYTFKITQDTELKANFEQENYAISIINDGYGLAYIDTTDKPTTGTYHYGDVIDLVNVPNTGYRFVNYTDQNNNVISSPFTVTGLVTIKANFEPDKYDVTVNKEGEGTVTGEGEYDFNSKASLTAVPAKHYSFINWTSNDGQTIAEPDFDVTVTKNIIWTAHFKIDQFNVILTSDENGTVSGSGKYNYNADVTVKAVAKPGYKFVSWTDKDNNTVSTEADYTFKITQNIELKANFEQEDYTVSIINDGHGSAYIDTTDKPTTGTYHYGDIITLANVPDTDYKFLNYTDKDGNIVSSPYTVTGNNEIKANFKYTIYMVTVAADDNGTATGGGTFKEGNTAVLTATPNEHYHFVNWTDEDGNISTEQTYNYEVSKTITWTAHFAIDQYKITLTSDDGGTVTGSGTYDYGKKVTIKANPKEGHAFKNWSDGNTEAERVITVNGDVSLSAAFDINSYTVSISADENGTAYIGDGDKSTSGTYDYGTKINITAEPNEGYHFVAWQDKDGNDLHLNANDTVTVTENMEYKAVFETNEHDVNLTLTATSGGTVTGSGTYSYGQDVVITAISDEDYRFISWSDSNTDAQRTITMDKNINLKAIFEKNDSGRYAILTNIDSAGGGSVTGGGYYNSGDQVKLSAIPTYYYKFINWTDSKGDEISTDENYTFTANKDLILTAHFNKLQETDPSSFETVVNGDGTLSITKYNGANTDVVIPEYINNVKVTKIADTTSGNPVFPDTVTSVVIPNSVTSIGDYAFYSCDALTNVTMGNSVASIGNYAFAHCDALTSVTIPDSATLIGNCAFYDDSLITTITIPTSVTYVGYDAFQGWGLNQTINIKGKSNYQDTTNAGWVKSSKYGPWNNGCNAKINYWGDIPVEEGFTSDYGVLTNEDGTLSITKYGGASTDVVIPEYINNVKVTKIADTTSGNPVFPDTVTNVVIANTITSIGNYAFYSCDTLTSVTIPDTVISIGDHAFYDCDALTNVTMGNSVASIGNYAFESCNALTSVTIPDSVTSIGDGAFDNCNVLTSVTIGNSVTSIGNSAFSNCGALTSVNMGDSVTSIGNWAFYDDSLITTITIPSSVTYVGYEAFNSWDSNQTINIKGKSSYQDTIDAGWVKSSNYGPWNNDCNAKINYLGNTQTSTSITVTPSNNYLLSSLTDITGNTVLNKDIKISDNQNINYTVHFTEI